MKKTKAADKESHPTLFDRALDGWINSLLSTSVLAIFLVISVLGNLIQFFLLTTKFDNEKIALVPPAITDTIHVRTGQVTQDFYREMALKAATLYGTYTPSTVHSNLALFLDYVTPRFYAEASKRLKKAADAIKTNLISQFFGIHDIRAKGPVVYVRGSIRRFASNGRVISQADDAIMIVRMQYVPQLKRVRIDNIELHDDYNKWARSVAAAAKGGA